MSYYSSQQSTYRKEEQPSSRYREEQPYSRYNSRENVASRTQLSATTRNVASLKQTMLQQEQIADLQRKIDLILMHNQKLQSQKQRYRAMFEQIRSQNTERTLQSNTARFMNQQSQLIIQKLRTQLQMSARTYQQKLNQSYESRKILKQQIATLSKIIEELNQQNRSLKLSIKEQSLKVQSLGYELKEEFIRQQAQLENRLRDQFLIRQIQLKNQKKLVIETYQRQLQDYKNRLTQEKQQGKKQLEQQENKLKEEFQEEKRNLINQMNQDFALQVEEIQRKHRQQLKRQHDKAITFIQQNIVNVQSQDQQIKKQYERQIDRLRQSLQSRKRLIDTLLSQQQTQQVQRAQIIIPEHHHSLILPQQQSFETSWLPELLAMKQQMRQLTTQYLQQSQLLKLKMTEKFEVDVKSLKKIYEDKIELMALHAQRIQQENTKLRDSYEKSLHNKIQAKKQFQLEKSKLKNVIRKLGVELHGIQEEFKINIQGIRDQNNTFSMTMMKSMIEVKQKASFYSQENRKLRKAYEQHQQQCIQTTNQAQQKVRYYEESNEKLKQKFNAVVTQLKEQIQTLQIQSQERQNQLRDSLNKQHEMIHSVVDGLRKDLEKVNAQNEELKKKCQQLQFSFKDKDDDIKYYRAKVDQLEADIQRLKMDLEMAGVNDKDHTDTINQWKNHYETIIAHLEDQKNIVIQKLAQRDEQLAEIIKKYKLLQEELAKVVKTLKKRSLVEKKVLQIGLDNNLVKNMADIFGKENV